MVRHAEQRGQSLAAAGVVGGMGAGRGNNQQGPRDPDNRRGNGGGNNSDSRQQKTPVAKPTTGGKGESNQ